MTQSATIHQFTGKTMRSHYLKKPSDPAEIARRRMATMLADAKARELAHRKEKDPTQWGISEDAGRLGGELAPVDRDAAKRITRAKRWDVFALLRNTKCGPEKQDTVLTGDHMLCVDRFHRLLAIRHRTAGASGTAPAVDGRSTKDYPRARVEAGVRLDGLVAHMDAAERSDHPPGSRAAPFYAKLLLALSSPHIIEGRAAPNWRKIVQDSTGEYRPDHQTKVVVRACDALEMAVSARADEVALKAHYERREALTAAA